MSYSLQMRGFWQYATKRDFDARYICKILKIGFATGKNVLESLRLEAKRDVANRGHLQRFFLVARVLLI